MFWRIDVKLERIDVKLERIDVKLERIAVERIDVKLRSYSEHEIPVIGEAKVQVAYRDQEAVSVLVVITGNDGPVLMGRDWLSVEIFTVI